MEAVQLEWGDMNEVSREVLSFADCQKIESSLTEADSKLWVCRYTDQENGWILSIATHGEPQSQELSLGGFRIAPQERAEVAGYSNDGEAINLAVGMEKKVNWSRLARVGGPLGYENLDNIVGGKCVLLPTGVARVGQPRDFELLSFAVACLQDFGESFGIRVNTGQDLGHGLMSDGKTHSLEFLNSNFPGSVLSDTSKPTGEGNYFALMGGLEALELSVGDVTIGLIGCGNIGSHVLTKLKAQGVSVEILEASPETRAGLQAEGYSVFSPEQKSEFVTRKLDALVINANGGTLDQQTIDAICENGSIRLITGCENLAMPDKNGMQKLSKARKIFCPTEYCGMMGYLTAVEEYLSALSASSFDIQIMLSAAQGIEKNARLAVQEVIASDFTKTFSDAVEELGGRAS